LTEEKTKMISRAWQTHKLQRWFSFSCLLLLNAIFAANSQAQMGGVDSDPGSRGTGGRNTIEGRIYYPSGRNVDKRLKVKLTGIRGGDFFTLADDTGAFSFRRISAGSYVVNVDGGSEYEPVNEQVEVVDASTARGAALGSTFNLQIQLRPKATSSAGAKAGVVNAALAGVPKPAADLYEKASESLRAGDALKAVDQLQQAVTLYPEFSLALNELGVIYQQLGQIDKAVEALRAAVNVAPEVFEIRLNLGLVLLKSQQFSDAEVQLRRAIEKRDSSTQAHLYRGKALIQLQQYADAEKELQRVIKLGGNDVPMAYRFLGALYNERGESQLAIEALEKYLSLEPKAKDAGAVRDIIKKNRARLPAKN
jgi:tetratricopeptide (TPR) repeat protein